LGGLGGGFVTGDVEEVGDEGRWCGGAVRALHSRRWPVGRVGVSGGTTKSKERLEGAEAQRGQHCRREHEKEDRVTRGRRDHAFPYHTTGCVIEGPYSLPINRDLNFTHECGYLADIRPDGCGCGCHFSPSCQIRTCPVNRRVRTQVSFFTRG
jgi:hypothetical protein